LAKRCVVANARLEMLGIQAVGLERRRHCVLDVLC
jgi:hypothetical protein